MKRRNFLTTSGTAILGGMVAASLITNESFGQTNVARDDLKLTPPKTGEIPVAVMISNGATVIDFAGPWEVFQDVEVDGGGFKLFTVAETLEPVTASAGLIIVPNYTYETAPQPKVVCIGAQGGSRSPAAFSWLKRVSETADVIMSVCTGAFILAQSGLIDGKRATTHHDFYDRLEKQFPKVTLKRGVRFVEEKKYSSAGGLTSGIDLALRIVDRYYGRKTAEKTAILMEYRSNDWKV